MIKNWSKFNESASEEFTEEMAQEILYFFGEDSSAPNELGITFNNIHKEFNLNHIVFYETGYDEMKEFIKYLYDRAKESKELSEKLIKLYEQIREVSVFPRVCEIEDIYLNIIENLNFDFHLTFLSTEKEIDIKLVKWSRSNLTDFIEFCKMVESTLIRLKSDKYTSKLESCQFHDRFIEFKINLKG